VEPTERYLQLCRQGRAAFIGGTAPAALVRSRDDQTGEWTHVPRKPRTATDPPPTGETEEITVVAGGNRLGTPPLGEIEVFPLIKKPGASFPELITIGRTANNDIVLKDVTVSRFHAFFRQRETAWVVGDAGSKNGTLVDGVELEPRKEHGVWSGANVRIGDLEVTFYTADQLFDFLAG
jgi:hypothetical protein